MCEPGRIEGSADRPNPAVHHVRWRDDIGPCPGVGDGLNGEQLERRVVVDVAVPDHAAVPVVGVLAEADVSDEEQPRHRLADGAESAGNDAVGIGRTAAARILVLRNPEEDDRGHAQIREPSAVFGCAVDRELCDAGHRPDRTFHPASRDHEERLDELLDRDAGLAHQSTERFATSQTTRAVGREAAHRNPFA